MSATPPHTGGRLRRGPPRLGEDTADVLADILGLGEDDVARLEAAGVLS
jgi:crotonobetainyl-CoA:carnitine CoA-transferase CaiB-like acyl-CoA transferase